MSLVPWQGVWAQGSLCSLRDAGLPVPPCHAMESRNPSKGKVLGCWEMAPVPQAEQTSSSRPARTLR